MYTKFSDCFAILLLNLLLICYPAHSWTIFVPGALNKLNQYNFFIQSWENFLPLKVWDMGPNCRQSASLFSLPLFILNLRMSTHKIMRHYYMLQTLVVEYWFSKILLDLHISCNTTKDIFYLAYETSNIEKAKLLCILVINFPFNSWGQIPSITFVYFSLLSWDLNHCLTLFALHL